MAHPDFDELLNALLPFARQMLSQHGEFFPFGASMDLQGNIRGAAGYTGDEHPLSQEVIDILVDGFRDEALKGKVRAVGVCLDVRTTPPGNSGRTDAICTRLEHSTGEAVEVYLPYKKGTFGRIKYGDLFASPGKPVVFHKSVAGDT